MALMHRLQHYYYTLNLSVPKPYPKPATFLLLTMSPSYYVG